VTEAIAQAESEVTDDNKDSGMLIRMLDKRLSVCYRLEHGYNLPNKSSQISARFP
jgi:hypothetical protein